MLLTVLLFACNGRDPDGLSGPTSPSTTPTPPEDTGAGTTGDTSSTVDPTNPTLPLDRGADFDGDGFDDLVVGAPYRDPVGAVYLYAGGADAAFDTTFDATVEGPVEGAIFGYVLDLVGDLDADGFDDLAVANEQTWSVRPEFVSVWFGAPGFALGAPLELAEDVAGGVFGHGLAGVGDANGDGVDDLVIGSFTGRADTPGRAWLVSGQPGGFDGSLRTELIPVTADGGFGMTAAGAGDVDGDGLSDLLVGKRQSGDLAIDDGYVDLFLGGAPFDGSSDQVLTGPLQFGSAMAGVGDWDGDGRDDMVITAAILADDAGTAWLYTGTGSGLDPTPTSEHTEGGRAFFGEAVAACRDVDGDDAPDVVIGAPYSTVSGSRTGAAYVVFGGDAADLEPDLILTGNGRNIGASVGAFDANADGYGDIVVNGAWYYGNAPDGVLLYFGGASFDDVPDATLVGPNHDAEFGFGVIRGFH